MKKHTIYLFSICLLALCLLGGCGGDKSQKTSHTNTEIKIVTTTAMIADAVQNVVGTWAQVIPLMGEGVDPHLYKATQGDLQKLQTADAIFYNGLHLEGKMQDVLERLGQRKPVVAISDNIPKDKILYASSAQKMPDPHIWFDLQIWQTGVAVIAQKLMELYPDKKTEMETNLAAYQVKLSQLHQKVMTEIATIPQNQRILITSHDAFGYFGQAYNIEVKALQGISTVSEFGLKDITELVDFIVEKKIKAIFVESSVAAKPMEAIVKGCQEKGHNITIGGTLFSDAMGQKNTPEGTYLGMVEFNLKTIVEALK